MIKKIMDADIVICKRNMARDTWLRIRRQGIGGSDAGAICGLNPYCSALQVYYDKIGKLQPIEETEAMRLGTDLEEYVAKRWAELMSEEGTPKAFRNCNYILCNPKYPFMYANVDRLIVGENAGLECKTTNLFNKTDFEGNNIPPAHYAQCLHYMAVTGADRWYICELVLGKKPYKFVIERSDVEKDIENLIEIERNFWNNNVVAGVEPAPDGNDKTDEVIDEVTGSGDSDLEIDLMPYIDKMKVMTELSAEIKDKEKQKKAIQQEIELYMNNATKGRSDNFSVSWAEQSRTSIDSARLKKELPKIYDEYSKLSSTRVFKLTKLKEINI